jgi:hypothetical protein
MDKTTKLLLLAIALGLWVNPTSQAVKQAIAYTSGQDFCYENTGCLKSINSHLSEVNATLHSIISSINSVDFHVRNK